MMLITKVINSNFNFKQAFKQFTSVNFTLFLHFLQNFTYSDLLFYKLFT